MSCVGDSTAPPLRVVDIAAVYINAVSITVTWTSPSDGGLAQTFTLTYNNSLGDSVSITNIDDPGEGKAVMRKVIDLAPSSVYAFGVTSINALGRTVSTEEHVGTAGK